MFTREEILRSPEYWFEDAQNELYRQVAEYMEAENLNRTELAQRLGVTKGYVSQILNGEFNYTLKKLIEISLSIGQVPRIEYQPLSSVIKEDSKTATMDISSSLPAFVKLTITGNDTPSPNGKEEIKYIAA